MEGFPSVTVLRLGHRPGRDGRMTTHVGLTARALGADRVIIAGEAADAIDSIQDVADRFGGDFTIDRDDHWRSVIRDWTGRIIHLTMYGLPIQAVEEDIRRVFQENEDSLLVIVGAEKMPFDVYEAADWNVAVTNQPHSEVAGLAVFLHRLFQGAELERHWPGGQVEVIPKATGKRMIESDTKPTETDS